MSVVLGYITCANTEEARMIAQKLLEQKLVACANIIPCVESHYVWQDNLEHNQESLLLVKTQSHLRSKIEQSILALHSYDCPCVVFYEAQSGLPAYLDWVSKQLS